MSKKISPKIEVSAEVLVARVRGANLRISAQKLNSVARVVRGLPVLSAQDKLRFLGKKGAVFLFKGLKAAVSAAKAKSMDEAGLFISKIEIGPGPFLKRGRPVSRGSFHPILKKTSRFLIELKDKKYGTKS